MKNIDYPFIILIVAGFLTFGMLGGSELCADLLAIGSVISVALMIWDIPNAINSNKNL